ncbi:MAG: hypothetical protein FGM33_04070 [Candidatus Kapabacteria bacterium]|nr:hypothetical protein [Candidatus Kapabacteria bacterium]
MPAERIVSQYSLLFDVRILHHYWLDDGTTLFDRLSPLQQRAQLLKYDLRSILSVVPTPQTRELIRGLGGLFRNTSLGIVVLVKPSERIADDAVFEFTLGVVDPDFASYTAYGLVVPRTAHVVETSTRRTLLYRSNGSLFSNLTGISRGSGAARQLYLSREYPARNASDRIESLVRDSGRVFQRLSDPPQPRYALIGAAAELPVFAHHGDVPDLEARSGIVGDIPSKGILLPDGAPSDSIALLRIAARHPSNSHFSCTSDGRARAQAPVFQVRLKNRQTMWRTVSRSNISASQAISGPYPMTMYGTVGPGNAPPGNQMFLDQTAVGISDLVRQRFI